MIELCKHRIHALHLNEETLLKDAENITVGKHISIEMHLISKIIFINVFLFSKNQKTFVLL